MQFLSFELDFQLLNIETYCVWSSICILAPRLRNVWGEPGCNPRQFLMSYTMVVSLIDLTYLVVMALALNNSLGKTLKIFNQSHSFPKGQM